MSVAAQTLAIATAKDAWPAMLGAWRIGNTDFAGVWYPETGAHGVRVPSRAHEVIEHPLRPGKAIALGRRPGEYVVLFDIHDAAVVKLQEAETMRHFNGHAVFSPDGKTLFTSENDMVSGKGLIGVRDADTLVKSAELPSYGVGPHGLLLEPDGTLLVANGGILTIPTPGTVGPALISMEPSLVRLDSRSGQLLGQWRLPDPYLSVRHMARAKNGLVGIALQAAHSEQTRRESTPIFALFDGENLRLVAAPNTIGLGGYAGDIASVMTVDGERFTLGCTHAGIVASWDTQGTWEGAAALPKACAIGAFGDHLIAPTEDGRVAQIIWSDQKPILHSRASGAEWENHVALL